MQANYIKNNLSGNDAIFYTMREMRKLINEFKIDPDIRVKTGEILFNIDGRKFKEVFENIFNWVRLNIRYQYDINEVETIQSPIKTLELGFGDCDDHSILIGTLLEAAGFPTKLAVVSNREDKLFTHVMVLGVAPTSQMIIFDTVEGVFGANYPLDITNHYIEGD